MISLYQMLEKLDLIKLIDKPEGCTSYDVIRHLKRQYPKKTKIGHAGTLDPMATGLLVIGVGSATKRLESIVQGKKSYLTTINLSGRSDTGDATGSVIWQDLATLTPPSIDHVEDILRGFIGDIQQTPSSYSAIKINGKRAYQLARNGIEVEMPSRTVEITAIKLICYNFPYLTIEVTCGKGTYIRTLGEDIGEALGLQGYLVSLRRLAIGEYHVKNAEKIQVHSKLKPCITNRADQEQTNQKCVTIDPDERK